MNQKNNKEAKQYLNAFKNSITINDEKQALLIMHKLILQAQRPMFDYFGCDHCGRKSPHAVYIRSYNKYKITNS